VGNFCGYNSILILILTTLISSTAFAKEAKAKASASAAVCVPNYKNIAPLTPGEAVMKSFESQLTGGKPMIPSTWKSEAGTLVKIYADDKGAIWLGVLNLPFEKFKGRSLVPQTILDISERSLKAKLAEISEKGSRRMASFCQDGGGLYLNPSKSTDKITLTPGSDATIAISFIKATYIFNDTVKQVPDN
jgi:hypothetical protein